VSGVVIGNVKHLVTDLKRISSEWQHDLHQAKQDADTDMVRLHNGTGIC